MNHQRAVVLLSGGLDSTTLLAQVRAKGFQVHALTFSYGQRHAVEIRQARRIARKYRVREHAVIHIPRNIFKGSALTGDAAVPKNRKVSAMKHGIPSSYVPARNTLFLSYALAFAESRGCADIFIGVNVLDYSGYPDCRPAFLRAFEKTARLGTRGGVEGNLKFRIRAPFLRMTKAQIIRLGQRLGVDYGLTRSCYDPGRGGKPCGRCDSCILRAKGFSEAGHPDPLSIRKCGKKRKEH